MNGKILKQILKVDAQHALYREDGTWYHHLKIFPGVLFDKNGYILFASREDYKKHPDLKHTKDLHVKNGISNIDGYILFSDEVKRKLLFTSKKQASEETIRVLREVSLILRNKKLVKDIRDIYKGCCQLCTTKLKIYNNVFYSEVHHIWPLGYPHNGPDVLENMISVCPNCHALLDLGAIKLNKRTLKVLRHQLIEGCVLYHNNKIYAKRSLK